jgi:hypothetical protein
MKAITINRDSWHYRFVNFATDFVMDLNCGDIHSDICTYTRYFLKGVFKWTFIGLVCTAFATILLSTIAYLIAHLLGYAQMMDVTAVVIVTAVSGSTKISEKFANRKRKPPGVIKQMYKHWHDKTCAPLTIE